MHKPLKNQDIFFFFDQDMECEEAIKIFNRETRILMLIFPKALHSKHTALFLEGKKRFHQVRLYLRRVDKKSKH